MQAMTELTEPANETANDTSDEQTSEQVIETNPFISGSVCLADLAHAQPPSVDYVLPRFAIAPGRCVVVIGQSGKGKTLFTSYLASCVAANMPLFGKYEVSPGEVLHLDYELGRQEMEIRYRQMIVGLGLDLHAAPGVWFQSYPRLRLDAPDARRHLEAAAHCRKIVVVDPLSRAVSAADTDPRVADALAMCSEISCATGTVFLWVHHEGKRLGTGYGRGSSAIQDSAGCVLRVSSPTPGRFLVEQTKCVPRPVAPITFVAEEVGERLASTGRSAGLRLVEFDPEAATIVSATNKTDVRQEIIRHLEEHPEGMGGRSLRGAVGGNTSRFVQSMRVLVAQNIVVVRPDPRDGRKQLYMLARNAPDFEPTNGTVIQFPGRRDESEGDDV